MEIRWMRAFLAVAEVSNYGRAAESLRIAQPAVSQQIQQLERHLGVKLFDRGTRPIRLTAAGEQFLEPCRAALKAVAWAEQSASAGNPAQEGRVRVGFSGAYGQSKLPLFARTVRKRYPKLELVLDGARPSGLILDDIYSGKLDLGFVSAALSHPEIRTRVISIEPLGALLHADHRLAKRSEISLSELRDDPFVTNPASSGSTLRLDVLAACHDAGFTPEIAQETSDGSTLTALVAAGVGVSLIPVSSHRAGAADAVVVPTDGGRHRIRGALAWADRPLTPLLETVLALAEELMPTIHGIDK
jgi:DNA-binding transcriptional LysR family regulator